MTYISEGDRRFWQRKYPELTDPKRWDDKVWKSVKIGMHASPNALIAEVREKGFEVGEETVHILHSVTSEPRTVELVRMEKWNITRCITPGIDEDWLARHLPIFGLEPANPEIALALRMDYSDQPEGEELGVVVEDARIWQFDPSELVHTGEARPGIISLKNLKGSKQVRIWTGDYTSAPWNFAPVYDWVFARVTPR
jgi:hypothetical protein